MKASYIKLIQTELKRLGYYKKKIDGLQGSGTNSAILKGLKKKTKYLPKGWEKWSKKRRLVAYLQTLCLDNKINCGRVDGYYGPNTEYAAKRLLTLKQDKTLPRPFGDIVPIRSNKNNFPRDSQAALRKFYGKPCAHLVKVRCPWTLRFDWNLSQSTRYISIHTKLAASLKRILDKAYAHYGLRGIKKHGLDRYGGSYNCRKKYGSKSSYSTHAWAVAIDWYPSRNKLNWGSDRATLSNRELDYWWELWEKEGWVSLGRSENRDWMHVQAAKRS